VPAGHSARAHHEFGPRSIYRGRHRLRENKLNSLVGMQSYQQVRRILCEATKKLSVLDTLPN